MLSAGPVASPAWPTVKQGQARVGQPRQRRFRQGVVCRVFWINPCRIRHFCEEPDGEGSAFLSAASGRAYGSVSFMPGLRRGGATPRRTLPRDRGHEAPRLDGCLTCTFAPARRASLQRAGRQTHLVAFCRSWIVVRRPSEPRRPIRWAPRPPPPLTAGTLIRVRRMVKQRPQRPGLDGEPVEGGTQSGSLPPLGSGCGGSALLFSTKARMELSSSRSAEAASSEAGLRKTFTVGAWVWAS